MIVPYSWPLDRCGIIRTSLGFASATELADMPNDELLTDEHVAELLAKDAQDCSLKFSTMGMQAYRSDKKYVHPHTKGTTG